MNDKIKTAKNLGNLNDSVTVKDKIPKKRKGRNSSDYYKFTLEETADISMVLDGLNADANLEILDDRGALLSSSNNKGKKQEVIETELDAGEYFVRVFTRGKTRTKYRFEIDSTTPERDPDSSPETATKIGKLTEDGYINRDEIGFSTSQSRDIFDWYEFELKEDAIVNLTLDGLRQNADVDIYEGKDKALLFSLNNQGTRPETLQTELDRGTYYVRVGARGRARTDYSLELNASSIPIICPLLEIGNLNELEGYINRDQIGFFTGAIPNRKDLYPFTLTGESDVNIILDELTANVNMRLLTEDGTVIYISTNKGTKPERISETLEAGEYTLEVFPQGNAKTDYFLDMKAEEIVVEPEPWVNVGQLNESYTAANQVGFVTGSRRDESDVYQFAVDEAKLINITLDGLTANLDLELLDSAGLFIDTSSNNKAKPEEITAFLAPGEYFARVVPKGSAKSIYRLSMVDFLTGEPDPTPTTKPLPTGELLGVLEADSDPLVESDRLNYKINGIKDTEDYASFILPQTDVVSINLTNIKGDTDIELYNSQGEVLGSFTSNKKNEEINLSLADDTYVMRLFGDGGKSIYNLQVSL